MRSNITATIYLAYIKALSSLSSVVIKNIGRDLIREAYVLAISIRKGQPHVVPG